jgi:class 3 adenylate cyclase/tetratricopeptide (TPR) repeat protein
MRCAACQTELIAGKRFCHACGTPVPLSCRRCGAELTAAYRFCPDCGLSVTGDMPVVPPPVPPRVVEHVPEPLAHKILATQGVIEGERKQVTVLFCDLVGSTAIAEQLDPEEYRELIERYLEMTFREIHGLEGIVNALAGDGLMALFGAPVAHEDAPERAVLTAVAIHGVLAAFDPPVLARRGLRLQARIGIHTGPVVVGTVGNDLKMDYTAIGDTTNLAARLQALAAPGTTLLSEATQRLLGGVVRVRPTGPLVVRGKQEPVIAYELLAVLEQTAPMTLAAQRGLTPFVGRARELEELLASQQRVRGGAPQVVAVVGEAGAGKSRLLYEFRRRLADEPVVLLEGRCSTLGRAVPYGPFVAMFRDFFGLVPGEDLDGAVEKAFAKAGSWRDEPELARRLVARLLGMPGAHEKDGEDLDLKRASFDAVTGLVLSESQRAPVVIVVEDVHLMDDGSRELLEALLARLGNARVMVVVSQRPDDGLTWQTSAAFVQLVLRRLPDAEVRTLVEAVAGGAVPDELASLLVARIDGSPFFAEEITRMLVEEAYIVADGGYCRLSRPLDEVRIPGRVEEVVAARLDRLGPSSKRVVQVAAVLGRQFRGSHLAAVLVDEGIDIPRELADLERRGVFHREHLLARDEYRFGESLTQEVAYEGLLLRQRRQLHERIALLLETSLPRTASERSALLAHHFARSDNRDRAVDALLQAAREAAELPSYRSAAGFYRQAWELAEAGGGDDERARRALLAATQGFGSLTVLFNLPQLADAERALARGREIAERLDDAEALSGLYYMQGILTMGRDREHFGAGLALAEESVAVAMRANLTVSAMRASRGLSYNYVQDGRFDLAARTIGWVLEELERAPQREQLRDLRLSARSVRALVYFFQDDLEAARAAAASTYAVCVEAGNRTVRCGVTATLAQVHLLRGDYGEARRWADESLDLAEATGNPAGLVGPASVALIARAALGEPLAAGRYVDLIEQSLPEGTAPSLTVRFLAEALLVAGERERAERLATALYRRAGGRLRQALLALACGDVAVHAGRTDDGERWFREALGLGDMVGARSVAAAAELGLARVAGLRGDAGRRTLHADRALGLARALGLGHYAEQADRLAALDSLVSAS